jgi:hypothetical protein
MNSQNPSPATNATRAARGDSFEGSRDVYDISNTAWDVRKIGSVAINTAAGHGFYMALDLTDTFQPRNNQLNPYSSCHGSFFFACYTFPEINYFIVHAFRDNYFAETDVTMGNAISQIATTLTSRVWQEGRFMGFYHITYSIANWYEAVGDLTSFSVDTISDNTWDRAIGR